MRGSTATQLPRRWAGCSTTSNPMNLCPPHAMLKQSAPLQHRCNVTPRPSASLLPNLYLLIPPPLGHLLIQTAWASKLGAVRPLRLLCHTRGSCHLASMYEYGAHDACDKRNPAMIPFLPSADLQLQPRARPPGRTQAVAQRGGGAGPAAQPPWGDAHLQAYHRASAGAPLSRLYVLTGSCRRKFPVSIVIRSPLSPLAALFLLCGFTCLMPTTSRLRKCGRHEACTEDQASPNRFARTCRSNMPSYPPELGSCSP